MDKIRLGNDIEMRWSIFTRDGDNKVPYNLEGRALTLSVVNRTGESEIEFFAEGNIVTGVFRGRDQKIIGKHGVILRENNGKDGMRTIDACDAFELVACSCEEALGSSGTIQLFHLTFDSTIGAITGTIDPILNYEAEQAEAERKANEIIRKANEGQRIDNEKQRNVNEILRNTAEEERENAEQERIVNEDLRKADEAERKTNEESRLQSESDRVSSEEERLYAESIRVANENARIASETKRAEAETARIEAEDKRIVSEKNRLSAESSRIANEDSRRANEDSRLSAEAKRVSAEEGRQIAEEERQAKFASMVVQTTGDATDKVMSQKAVTEALKGKQNKLTAGKGISIDGDVISATLDMDIVRVVDALPSVGEANIIYLVPAEQPSENDLFEEWVWTDKWERIGSAKIDLSNYATKGYVDTKISSTEETLVHKDGFERITGIKQFQNGISVGRFNSLVANEDGVESGAWLDQGDNPAPFIVADPSADDHAATKLYVDGGLATKQNALTDTDGSYGQRVAELEKEGIASQAKLSEFDWKTEDISRESANDESDAIIYQDNNGNEVGRINAEGADFKNLKSNGVSVITDVSDKQDKINQISESVTTSEEEEQVFSNDDETEIYVKIGSYGIKARGIYDLNGNPIGGGVRIFNPYVGLDFSNTINSQTHEHCFTATGNNSLANSFKRGIRVFACSHYQPAIPRFPFSGWSVQYQDYTSVEDLTLTMRTSSGSIPSFAVDGETINTDTLPQIANAEHPLISGMPGHFNLLGCLWGEPGHNLGNANAGGTLTPSEYASWKESHALVTRESLKAALEVESNWQFGKALAFGTINHNYNSTLIKGILDEFPTYFKAMELFNQGYGKHYNQRFRDAYDELLRQGYKIWGTSVVDWQGDWATWNFIDDTDKAEWTAKYNALPSSEKAQYADAQAYYMAVGRYQIDRGMNVVLMPKNYESLEPQAIAREVVKAYNGGRYYMVGIGNHTMTILVESGVITFKVSDIADTIKVITASGTTTYNGRDAIQYAPNNTDKYVRFEAEWSDGDFVYSNPCWIN